MAISLNDILTAPTDPDSLTAHLTALGAVPPPPPPTSIPSVNPPDSGALGPNRAPTSARDMNLMMGASAAVPTPKGGGIPSLEMPAEMAATPSAIPSAAPPPELAPFEAPKKLSPIEQLALPKTSPAAPPGSAAFYQNELERMEAAKANPWGSAENHPGIIGRLAHIGAKVGNIAGNAIIPNIMAATPGTELNTRLKEEEIAKNLGEAQTREGVERERQSTEATQELQRENLKQEMQKRMADQGQSLTEDKVGNITGWKDKNNVLHSLDAPETPQAIRDIAATTQQKLNKPTFEKLDNGDVVALKTDASGKVSSEVVAHSDPKLETELADHVVNGVNHKLLINKKNGETIKDLGESKLPNEAGDLRKELQGEKLVMVTDANGGQHLMTRNKAEASGYSKTQIAEANPKERDDAETNTGVLNDMGAKTRNLRDSLPALNQNVFQRGIISSALSMKPDSLLRAGVMSQASELSKRYIQDVDSLRESALALPKQLTGGSRVSETQAEALWRTLPAASGDSKYGMDQLRKFNENLERIWQKVPEIEGQKQERIKFEEGGGGAGGGKVATMDNVNAYAQKHNITPAQAKKFFEDQHYTVK